VLLRALADAPPDQGLNVIEALTLLAGEKGPAVGLGEDAVSRQKCRDAWTRWWQEYGSSVDLANRTHVPRFLGYTLIVQSADSGVGRVLEVGRDGKVRWQIDGLALPVDAEVLAGDRILIAEFSGMRVTERDFKGNILWQKQGLRGNPTNVQRLANGHTFIATNQEVLEVDRAGQEVFTRNFPGTMLFGAAKTRNGEIFCFLQGGTCVRLDAAGKEIKNFPSGRNSQHTSGIDVLPSGRILITQPNLNTVAEVDAEGKTYRVIDAPGVTTASGLANGHILAASFDNRILVELDRTGKVIWEYKDGYHQFRARRR
jgi:PQQ-like domain